MTEPGAPMSFFNCGKCLQVVTHPMVFACLHSVCKTCSNAAETSGRTSDGYYCPVCHLSSGKPKANRFLMKAKEFFSVDGPLPTAKEGQDCQVCQKRDRSTPASHVCLDCPVYKHYCDECLVLHEAIMKGSEGPPHRTMTSEEFADNAGQLPPSSELTCGSHPKHSIRFVCQQCRVQLCMSCKLSPVCPRGVGENREHKIEDVGKVAERLRSTIQKEIDVCLSNCNSLTQRITEGDVTLSVAIQKAKDFQRDVNRHRQLLLGLLAEIETEVDKACRLKEETCRRSLKELTDIQDANKKGADLGARALLYSPDAQLEETVQEIKQLQVKPPPKSKPFLAGHTISFTIPDTQAILSQLEDVAGSLTRQPSIHHQMAPAFEYNNRPADVCTVFVASHELTLEAAGTAGLHCLRKGKRTQLDSHEATGVCVSHDGKTVYVARGCSKVFTIHQLLSGDGGLWLASPKIIEVSNAGLLQGVAACANGRVACTDVGYPRITVHEANGSLMHIVEVNVLGKPVNAAWSPCGLRLYVVSFDESVMCILLRESRLAWTRELKNVYNIKMVMGQLYVTQFTQVTVLDPENGNVLSTIKCPGDPCGLEQHGDGDIVILIY